MDKWFFIVNPSAGNGKAAMVWPEIASNLRANGLSLDYIFTEFPGHAHQCVDAALRNGYRNLAAVGGDGTNFEVINGLMKQKSIDLSEIRYTLFPIGTGNDWARQHGIPKSWKSWIAMINRNETLEHDIGVIDFLGHEPRESVCFINVAGLAYDGYIGYISGKYKRFLGSRFFYLALVFWGLFKYRLNLAAIRIDNHSISGHFYTINAGICRFSGGGMQLTPHADPSDAKLALTVAGNLSKMGVLLNTPRFYNGRIGNHPKVTCLQAAEIEVKSLDSRPMHVEADGEYLGLAPVRIRLKDQKLTIIRGH